MSDRKIFRSVAVMLLLVGALALSVSSCFGGGGDSPSTTKRVVTTGKGETTTSSIDTTDSSDESGNDDLSTFKSKDPFIPQAVPTTTTTNATATTNPPTSTTAASTTTTKPTTTTTKATTTTTKATTTTTQATTTTQSTTTTTSGYLHTMTVLSISTVGADPVVTFRVDGQTYSNRLVGAVVSTTWGDVMVVAIDFPGQVATFLHGSETVILAVGDSIHE